MIPQETSVETLTEKAGLLSVLVDDEELATVSNASWLANYPRELFTWVLLAGKKTAVFKHKWSFPSYIQLSMKHYV